MDSESPNQSSTDPRREFAIAVVQTLRAAGFEALWAGGCVRDELLGKVPKDFDVASTALPDDVIRVFGKRRTVAVGASFGVVMVLGPTKAAGQIEVATFRSDGEYLDGRRPTSVQFCRPEEDAQRRDFTINGLFFDPISKEVIDYVGGRNDLAAGVVRAIGDPAARFHEDKLRLLRAVRFAATFHFQLEQRTAEAVKACCRQLNVVSVERIAQELRRMLSHATREISVQMMEDTGLLAEVLPEICSANGLLLNDQTFPALKFLESNQFETALAVLLRPLFQNELPELRKRVEQVDAVCRRLRLSNDETGRICWLLSSLPTMNDIAKQPLHVLKPLLANPSANLLLELSAAIAVSENRPPVDAEFCRRYLSTVSFDVLSPATLIDGRDVMQLGIAAGPVVRDLLAIVRNEQLDEQLANREQAVLRLKQLVGHINLA